MGSRTYNVFLLIFTAIGIVILIICLAIVRKEVFPSSSGQMQAEEGVSYYPVRIMSFNEKGIEEEQVFDRAPQRAVAVWQNSIETLLALGVGDRIVAGTGVPRAEYVSPTYRSAYEKIPYTGLHDLDMETITMMNPDFITGWSSTFSAKTLRSTEYWHERGVHTYISANSLSENRDKTVENEYADILNAGRIFNREKKAEEIVDAMKEKIGRAEREGRRAGRHPKGLIVELQGKRLTVYGKHTLAGNILESMGGTLLEADAGYISREQLIELNPEALFVVLVESDYDIADRVLSWFYSEKAFNSVDCIREHRITALPLYSVYSPGIRMTDGIDYIGQGLYPELFKGQKSFMSDTGEK